MCNKKKSRLRNLMIHPAELCPSQNYLWSINCLLLIFGLCHLNRILSEITCLAIYTKRTRDGTNTRACDSVAPTLWRVIGKKIVEGGVGGGSFLRCNRSSTGAPQSIDRNAMHGRRNELPPAIRRKGLRTISYLSCIYVDKPLARSKRNFFLVHIFGSHFANI
jgi:hypothetical protein